MRSTNVLRDLAPAAVQKMRVMSCESAPCAACATYTMYTIGPDTREVKLVSCCFGERSRSFFRSQGLKDMPVDRRATTLEAEEMACGIFSIFVATGLQLRETFVLSLRTKFLLLPPENSENETIVSRLVKRIVSVNGCGMFCRHGGRLFSQLAAVQILFNFGE